MVQTVAEGKSREEDIKRMALSRQLCRVFRKTIAQVGSAAEVREVAAQGRVGVIWSVNGPPLVGKLDRPGRGVQLDRHLVSARRAADAPDLQPPQLHG